MLWVRSKMLRMKVLVDEDRLEDLDAIALAVLELPSNIGG